MDEDKVKIKFQFPEIKPSVKDDESFVQVILDDMRASGDIGYTGYDSEASFKDELVWTIGKKDIVGYEPISKAKKASLGREVRTVLERCHRALPHPDLPIFVFIYPWFPSMDDRASFGGVTAFTAYYSMHIFIDLRSYTEESLAHTIAHEWNHLVFYRYHTEPERTIRTNIAMEGLAEIFREEVFGGEPAPWSVSIPASKAKTSLLALGGVLEATDHSTYRDVFYGGHGYERWTGYSIGYHLSKEFREENTDLSWTDIVKKDPRDILGNK